MCLECLRDVSLLLGEFQTHAFHVVPSKAPIVSVMNLQGQQNSLQKTDQLAKPGKNTVNG